MQQFRDPLIGGASQDQILLLQIVLGGEVQIDGRRLHHRAHPPPDLCQGPVPAGDAVKGIGAGRGGLQAADEPDEGGFACAVPAYQAVDGALGHVHAQAVQGFEMAVVLAQRLRCQNIVHREVTSVSL